MTAAPVRRRAPPPNDEPWNSNMWNPELSVEDVVDLTPPEPTIGTGGGAGFELDLPIVDFGFADYVVAHSLNFLGALSSLSVDAQIYVVSHPFLMWEFPMGRQNCPMCRMSPSLSCSIFILLTCGFRSFSQKSPISYKGPAVSFFDRVR